MATGLGDLIAERVDWIDGRHDPHWVIRRGDSMVWLARYPVREYPDGLQAIQQYRDDALASSRIKHPPVGGAISRQPDSSGVRQSRNSTRGPR